MNAIAATAIETQIRRGLPSQRQGAIRAAGQRLPLRRALVPGLQGVQGPADAPLLEVLQVRADDGPSLHLHRQMRPRLSAVQSRRFEGTVFQRHAIQ